MKCTNCFEPIPEGASFCINCGQKVAQPPVPSPTDLPQEPQAPQKPTSEYPTYTPPTYDTAPAQNDSSSGYYQGAGKQQTSTPHYTKGANGTSNTPKQNNTGCIIAIIMLVVFVAVALGAIVLSSMLLFGSMSTMDTVLDTTNPPTFSASSERLPDASSEVVPDASSDATSIVPASSDIDAWYDVDWAAKMVTYYEREAELLPLTDEGVVERTAEEWENVSTIELCVLLKDEDGYIEIGYDNLFDVSDDGNLLLTFDGSWVSLNDEIVPYYFEKEVYLDDEDWYTYGYVPVELNGEEYAELILFWSTEEPNGAVAGYRTYVDGMASETLYPLATGDTFKLVFDCYTNDFVFDSSYLFGTDDDCFVVADEPINVGYSYLGDELAVAYYRIADVDDTLYVSDALEFDCAQ